MMMSVDMRNFPKSMACEQISPFFAYLFEEIDTMGNPINLQSINNELNLVFGKICHFQILAQCGVHFYSRC